MLFSESATFHVAPGVSPRQELLIPTGYLPPGKWEQSEEQSRPPLYHEFYGLDFGSFRHSCKVTQSVPS